MKDKKSKVRIFSNNAYAVKTVWQISKTRVTYAAISSVTGYAEWIFISIFFLRYVINAIETEAPFETILLLSEYASEYPYHFHCHGFHQFRMTCSVWFQHNAFSHTFLQEHIQAHHG